MFSGHSYLTTNNMTTIFETDHTILNSLTRMRILTIVILLLGNYTKTRIDCSVAFLQLLLNEDCNEDCSIVLHNAWASIQHRLY